MRVRELVGKGYFPEELPPAFTTENLGFEALSIDNSFSKNQRNKLENKETECISFTVPKVGFSRRIFGIPNPIHQIELSKIIAFNWSKINDIYSDSKISASVPIKDPDGKKAIVPCYKYGIFKEKCVEASFNKNFELKTDIAKYFPSIYTHSISWVIHSKEEAKLYKNRNNMGLIGNKIDKAIRKGQYGQTNGIPIGPDTSRIIAEIFGCKFDKILTERFDITGFRFMDDCVFYFSSYNQAENALKCFEQMLTEFGLGINEEKTTINKLHYSYESDWSILLGNYRIRYSKKGSLNVKGAEREKRIRSQRKDIKNFISFAFKLREENPKKSVLKYAVRKLRKKEIFKENWSLFESLLYKMGMSEPIILPDILGILLSHDSWVDQGKLTKFIQTFLENHDYKGHNFEISWGLWIAKTFSIEIDDKIAQNIVKSGDTISIIIILDMKEQSLISSTIDLSKIESELIEEGLYNECWLLTYESIKKGWLKPNDPNLLENSVFFNELKERDIEFYDSTKQIDLSDYIDDGIDDFDIGY